MATLDLNPPGSNASGDELLGNPPLGMLPSPQDSAPKAPAFGGGVEVTGVKASGPELAPLGLRPQMEVKNSFGGDAAWVAQQAASVDGPTRTGVPYAEMNHGGQPTVVQLTGYDDYKHVGRQA